MIKMTKRIKVLAGLASWSVLTLALAGCQEPTHGRTSGGSSIRTRSTPPAYMLSVNDLGSQLGLSVTKTGNPYYELKNTTNRVLLFMYEDGRVYVNGESVASVGPVVDVNGTYYVSEILLTQIRPFLKSGQTVWTPAPLPTPSPWTPRTGNGLVVIDAGHGGKDPGATSYLGHLEKDIVLQIAKRVAANLRQRGVEVIMTRSDDTFIELEERAAIANRANADLFVSIHADSNHDRLHQGFTLYIARSASEASRRAGRQLETAMSRIGIPSKGLRTADYRVLVRTQCPAVLVEAGFLSNPNEAAMLLDGGYQERIASAIADGIVNTL